jgi:hypothetical protein
MKKINILYWIFTGIFAAFMLFTAIPNIMVDQGSIDLITNQLGFPKYFISFIGVAKTLGVIGILIPGFPRIKEWAYAGLFFDLLGATYAAICVEGFHTPMLFMVLPFGFLFLSYFYYHKKHQASAV